MSIVSKFNVFQEIEPQLVAKMVLFYIPFNGKVLFVTQNCDVYAYDTDTKQLRKFPELCNKAVVKFEFNGYHYLALTCSGSVYSWGNNHYGQLGTDTTALVTTEPKLISFLKDHFVIDVCSGDDHSMVLTQDGKVFAFGNNAFGQLGSNNNQNQSKPIPVKVTASNDRVVGISCGCHHSVALTEFGDVFVWGLNKWGQLGIGDVDVQRTPVQLKSLPKVKKLSCGDSYTVFLTRDGDIYFCGSFAAGKSTVNKHPVKCVESVKFTDIATSIRSNLCVALSQNGKCFLFGECYGDVSENLKPTAMSSIEELFALYGQTTCNNVII